MNILLVGDNCIDHYVYGSVKKISPEAPIPILDFEREEIKAGMAANVKLNLEALGATVRFVAPSEVCVKKRYIHSKTNYQLLRVDTDYNIKKTSINFGKLDVDAIVISDYNKGFVTFDMVDHLRTEFSGPIFMDTKKKELACFNDIFIKINDKEYKDAFTLPPTKDLIITQGAKGAEYCGKLYPSYPSEVYDVTGAGDTFLAALAVEYIRSKSIPTAIDFANKIASISVKHYGCYVVTKNDLSELLTV
jgi:D-glycero-beta-D-manno-heptose-7-phosphate kinase